MKIAIIDDHPLARKGLASILSLEEDCETIIEATNVQEGIDIIDENRPDIALIDLRLGNESGLDIIKEVNQKVNSKFVILTSSANKEDFLMAEHMGVDGYVLKEALPDELIYAIRLIRRGRKYYDPGLLAFKMTQEKNNRMSGLTAREQDVLNLLGKGLSNKQIAKELVITEHTVKKHVSQVLAKLELKDRTQVAIFANNHRLAHV